MHHDVTFITIFHVIAVLLMSLNMRSGSLGTPAPHKAIKLRAYPCPALIADEKAKRQTSGELVRDVRRTR
jgi:hypothetical protein